jgi:tRNA(fMet)-specific endonuclease VapC
MLEQRDYLLDSMMLAHFAAAKCAGDRSKEEATKRVVEKLEAIRARGNCKIFISSVTVGESEYGLKVATKADVAQQAEARRVVDAFLPSLVFGIDTTVAREYYAELRARLFNRFAPKDRRGLAKSNYVGEWTDPVTQKMLGIQENDVWIAAIAMAYNLTLVSSDKMNNIRQVAGSDLSFEDWGTVPR